MAHQSQIAMWRVVTQNCEKLCVSSITRLGPRGS